MRTVAAMVADAKARVEDLTPHEVAAAKRQGALIVDLREPDEREAMRTMPGAVLAPRGMLEF